MNRRVIPIGFVCAGLLAATGAWAQIVEENLNSLAKTGEDGKIIVLSDGGGSYDGATNNVAATAFDNDPATFYDPEKEVDSWVGYELTAPKMLTKVRVKGRSAQKGRMIGCLFQGSNRSDFPADDTFTFCQANPPGNWNASEWYEIPLAPIGKSFKYFRIMSNPTGKDEQGKYCGNVAELEFWGADLPAAPGSLAQPQVTEGSTSYNNRVKLVFQKTSGALSYLIEKRFPYEEDASFRKIAEYADFRLTGNTITFIDPDVTKPETIYRISAVYSETLKSETKLTVVPSDPYILNGTVIGETGNPYTAGCTRDTVFDGNLGTFVDADGWVGLDLGAPKVVRGVRYCPRSGQNKYRMKNGLFQISNDPTFTRGVTDLYQIPDQNPAENVMTEQMFDQPQKGRYVRFKPAYDVCNVSEIEFLGDGSPYGTPGGFTVDWEKRENATAKLTWTVSPQDSFKWMLVQRATAPGGPWTDVEKLSPNAETTWIDETAAMGVRYYYRVAYTNEIADTQTPLNVTDSATWRRVQWLERSAPTTLREGAVPFWTMGQYGSEGDVGAAFDNRTDTGSSGKEKEGRIGVTLDKPYVIAFVRVAPRVNQAVRLNGAEVWACTEGEDKTTAGRKIAGPVSGAANNRYVVVPTDREMEGQPFKTVFLTRKAGENFFCNVGELEVYGWDPDAVPRDLLLAPETVTLSHEGNSMKIAWTEGENAGSYRVERKTSPDAEWELVKDGIPSGTLSYVDTTAPLGVKYYYQVASQRTTETGAAPELAYSETSEGWFYMPGEGTGFHAVYTQPYRAAAVDGSEQTVLTREDQPASFNREGVAELSEGAFLAVWTAKLIIPIDGEYTFKMKQDDGAALWIDDQPVINERWNGDKDWLSGKISLTKGEHVIRVDYNGLGGIDTLTLKWGGPVPEEIIPVSQLIPAPAGLPAGWEGERTFNVAPPNANDPTIKKGHVAFGENGAIVIQGGGMDIWAEREGFHFLWKTVKGDFEATMKYQFPDGNLGKNLGCKIMIMARNELNVGGNTGSVFYAPAVQGTEETFTYSGVVRQGSDERIQNLGNWLPGSRSGWLKVSRKDNTFTSWWKANEADEWTQIDTPKTIGTLNKSLFVGPALTTNTKLGRVTVTDLEISEVKRGTIFLLQ